MTLIRSLKVGRESPADIGESMAHNTTGRGQQHLSQLSSPESLDWTRTVSVSASALYFLDYQRLGPVLLPEFGPALPRSRRMSERQWDDKELLQKLAGGGDREEILRQLYFRYHGRVNAYFKYRFSAEDSEDLSQKTFIRAFHGLSSFRGQSSFKTWLYEIARNVANNEFRDQRAEKRAGDVISLENSHHGDPESDAPLPIASDESGPLEDLLHGEEARLIQAEVARMPPRMRQCFESYCEGFKFREIADLLSVTTNAVKSHIGEAKKRVREALASYRKRGGR